MKTRLSLFFIALSTILSVNAQYTEEINSNRPGVSRGAWSVGKNVAQVETGPYMVREKHTPLKSELSGLGFDLAARYGLFFEELELNLEATYQSATFTDSRSTIPAEQKFSNFKNLVLGAKYLVYDPYKDKEEDKPNLMSYHANKKFKWKTLIPAVSVYVGGNYDFKNNPYLAPDVEGFSPKVIISSQNNFKSGWVMVINIIKDRIGSEYSDLQWIVTFTKAINEKWVGFGEAQAIYSDFYADNLFRLGGAYLHTKDMQFDAGITFNTKDTPSVFNANFGVSYRFDMHIDPEEKDNGTDVIDEFERKENKKRGRKNKKKKGEDGEPSKPKKENQIIDFDSE
jgi:hypothetical protein